MSNERHYTQTDYWATGTNVTNVPELLSLLYKYCHHFASRRCSADSLLRSDENTLPPSEKTRSIAALAGRPVFSATVRITAWCGDRHWVNSDQMNSRSDIGLLQPTYRLGCWPFSAVLLQKYWERSHSLEYYCQGDGQLSERLCQLLLCSCSPETTVYSILQSIASNYCNISAPKELQYHMQY